MLEYKGFTFFEGDPIRGQINGIDVEGRLHCNEPNYYFCQDNMMGGAGTTTYEYRYGWTFRKKGLDELTDGVEIFIPDGVQKEIPIIFNKDVFEPKFIESRATGSTLRFKYHDIFKIDCSFNKLPEDDSVVIYNIFMDDKLDTVSEEVKDKVIERFKRELRRFSRDFLVITYDKSEVNTFFEQEANFYRLNTWLCRESGNLKNLLSCHIQ